MKAFLFTFNIIILAMTLVAGYAVYTAGGDMTVFFFMLIPLIGLRLLRANLLCHVMVHDPITRSIYNKAQNKMLDEYEAKHYPNKTSTFHTPKVDHEGWNKANKLQIDSLDAFIDDHTN